MVAAEMPTQAAFPLCIITWARMTTVLRLRVRQNSTVALLWPLGSLEPKYQRFGVNLRTLAPTSLYHNPLTQANY